VETGSARHTQQPGSDRRYLLSQEAFKTGTAAASPSRPGRRTHRLYHCRREREKEMKVKVHALITNVAEVYQEMPVLHSKSRKLSKRNYPLQ